MPVPYQYSVLRQFDNDPDDDVVDPEHSLNMMVEDTSSDEEEIIDNANQSSTSSKTIGAIDTNPPDANAVIFKNTNHNTHNNLHKFLLASFFLGFQPFLKPFQPATLPVSITETAEASTKHLKTGRRRSGSSNLLGDESDKSSSNFNPNHNEMTPLSTMFLFRKHIQSNEIYLNVRFMYHGSRFSFAFSFAVLSILCVTILYQKRLCFLEFYLSNFLDVSLFFFVLL